MEQKQKDFPKYPEGLKWTKQRKSVFQVLQEAKEPLTVLQIYERVVLSEPTEQYAASTIYRILSAFEEKALVSKTDLLHDGTVTYELCKESHTHYAVCLSCHKKVALPECPFEQVHLPKTNGEFEITGHKLELYGICKECKSV